LLTKKKTNNMFGTHYFIELISTLSIVGFSVIASVFIVGLVVHFGNKINKNTKN